MPEPVEQHRVVDTYRDLKGRYTANVERGGQQALGHSWSSYEAAITDALVFLDSCEVVTLPDDNERTP